MTSKKSLHTEKESKTAVTNRHDASVSKDQHNPIKSSSTLESEICKDKKIFLVPRSFSKEKASGKDVSDLEAEIFQKWIAYSGEIMYAGEPKDARMCLMRDIKKYPSYWFRSGDLDSLVAEFVVKILEEKMVALTPEELELIKTCIEIIENEDNFNLTEKMNGRLEALLKKLESL